LAEQLFGWLGSPELIIKVPPDNQSLGRSEQGSMNSLVVLLVLFVAGAILINSPQAHGSLHAVTSGACMINGISADPFACTQARECFEEREHCGHVLADKEGLL
jgi:hypothetical protein